LSIAAEPAFRVPQLALKVERILARGQTKARTTIQASPRSWMTPPELPACRADFVLEDSRRVRRPRTCRSVRSNPAAAAGPWPLEVYGRSAN
jgi:hypothetical protein